MIDVLEDCMKSMLLGEKSEFRISPQNGGFLELATNSGVNMTFQDLEEHRKNPEEGLRLMIKIVSHDPNQITGSQGFQRNLILPMA